MKSPTRTLISNSFPAVISGKGEPSFYVADSSGTSLLFSGTSCGAPAPKKGPNSSPSCSVALDDGNYIWRTSGRSGSWSFCGQSGNGMVQIAFSVSGGVCTAQEPVSADVISYVDGDWAGLEDQVRLEGVVEIHGLSKDSLSDAEMAVVQHAISQEFNDARIGSSLSSSSVKVAPVSTVSAGERKLVDEKHPVRLSFDITASVVPNRFRFGTTDELNLKNYIDQSARSGMFGARLRTSARLLGIESLRKVNGVSFLSLSLLHRSVENTAMSTSGSIVVISCAVLGLIFGVLLALYFSKKKIVDKYKYDRAASSGGVFLSDIDSSSSHLTTHSRAI